ncbi:hypothetical protein ACFQYP_09610 [Nonomuraea antimicrobica]
MPPATEPVSERYHLMAAARTLIERLATVRPVLLVIDDLQWATLESLQMLSALMWDADALPLLVLAMSRPVPVESAMPELHKLTAGARVVPVPSFGPDEVSRALAHARSSGDPEVLHRITGGNAFLITEVIRSWPRARTSTHWPSPTPSPGWSWPGSRSSTPTPETWSACWPWASAWNRPSCGAVSGSTSPGLWPRWRRPWAPVW